VRAFLCYLLFDEIHRYYHHRRRRRNHHTHTHTPQQQQQQRYVSLVGYPGVPTFKTVTAHFIHTSYDFIGDVSFSDPMLTAVQHITRTAAMSNFQSIPTDCPQRERRGWLGDAQLSTETNFHNFDMAAPCVVSRSIGTSPYPDHPPFACTVGRALNINPICVGEMNIMLLVISLATRQLHDGSRCRSVTVYFLEVVHYCASWLPWVGVVASRSRFSLVRNSRQPAAYLTLG
jgi:hypothetical protein